jgi:FkbM family methyltransferase
MKIEEKFYGEFDTDKAIRNSYFPDRSYKGVMVEVGAATPEYLSLSKHYRDSGWRCICIEPNPRFVKMHAELGNEVYPFACGRRNLKNQDFFVVHTSADYKARKVTDHSTSALHLHPGYRAKDPFEDPQVERIKVDVFTLNTILAMASVPKIDLLCVDVEGGEMDVMEGIDLQRYRPSVVLIENYLNQPNYTRRMNELGYQLKRRIRYNHIFVRNTVAVMRPSKAGVGNLRAIRPAPTRGRISVQGSRPALFWYDEGL